MTREEILRDYEEVEGIRSDGCHGCDLDGDYGLCGIELCKPNTIFKRKKEKVVSKCEVVFSGIKFVQITGKGIPDRTFFYGQILDKDARLFYKTGSTILAIGGNDAHWWHNANELNVSNYQPVNVKIEATPI